MLSDQSRTIKLANSTYSRLRNTFEKEIKTVKDQRIKQDEALKALKPEGNQELGSIEGLFLKKMRNIEIKNEIDKIRNWEENIKRKDL